MVIYSGFSHWKWWFSIAMLVYQRVYPKIWPKMWYIYGTSVVFGSWRSPIDLRLDHIGCPIGCPIGFPWCFGEYHPIKSSFATDGINWIKSTSGRFGSRPHAAHAAHAVQRPPAPEDFHRSLVWHRAFPSSKSSENYQDSSENWHVSNSWIQNCHSPEFWLRRRKNLTLASPFVGLRGDALRPPGVTLFPGKSPISIGERIWSDPHGTSIPRLSLKPPWQHRQNGSSRTAHTEFSGAIPPGSGPTERNFHVQNLRIQGLCEASASSQERCTLCSLPDIQSMNASEDMRNGNDSYPLGIQHNITVT